MYMCVCVCLCVCVCADILFGKLLFFHGCVCVCVYVCVLYVCVCHFLYVCDVWNRYVAVSYPFTTATED